ncbi:MAG: SRPBCC family protein [Desulfovibrionales bacterium]
MKVERSIQILASPQTIWPFLTDPQKIILWFDTLQKCEFAGKTQNGLGTTYYVEEKVPGPLRKVNFEAVRWDEYEQLVLKMTSGKNVNSYEISWRLEHGQSGTTFHFTEEVGMPFGPVGKVLGKLGQRKANGMVEGMLVKLKELSENN